ncbi:MAG: SH3 domain-containing protein [Croceibacterium sp.]
MRRVFACLLLLLSVPAAAQERDVPYWATMRADEVNMRVGPSEEFPIAWVYRRQGLPVKVVRVREGWRLVQDPDGQRGWIVARLLNPVRGAIVSGEGLTEMRAEANSGARLLWKVEPGVSGALGSCSDGWCKFDVAGRKGWVRQSRLWGAGEP